MNLPKTTFQVRAKLLGGATRRLFLNVFRPGYVRANLAQRHGECQRCGACCQLAGRCNFFREADNIPSCMLYSRRRPPNCISFPINSQDLADRDLISPNRPCGYRWSQSDTAKEPPIG